jgi:hypothetical protein
MILLSSTIAQGDDSYFDPVCLTTDIENTTAAALLGSTTAAVDQLLKPSCP